jgi:hypothetical protein
MASKRSVILQGDPIVNEDGVTATTIYPGYLVQGVSTIAAQSINDTRVVPATFALEREELGAGIDDTYFTSGSGTGHAYYSSGDRVKVGAFGVGMRVTAMVASGQVVSEDTLLTSDGAGKLKAATTSAYARARSLETLNGGSAVTVDTLCKIEIV